MKAFHLFKNTVNNCDPTAVHDSDDEDSSDDELED